MSSSHGSSHEQQLVISLQAIKMTCQCTRIMQTNLVNVSLITNINKSLKMLLDINLTYKFYTTCTDFYSTIMDSMILQWTIPTWQHQVWSLESRSSPFTTILSYILFNQLQAYYLTPEMLQLLANQMLHVLLPSQNDSNYSEHVLHTRSPLIISTSTTAKKLWNTKDSVTV